MGAREGYKTDNLRAYSVLSVHGLVDPGKVVGVGHYPVLWANRVKGDIVMCWSRPGDVLCLGKNYFDEEQFKKVSSLASQGLLRKIDIEKIGESQIISNPSSVTYLTDEQHEGLVELGRENHMFYGYTNIDGS